MRGTKIAGIICLMIALVGVISLLASGEGESIPPTIIFGILGIVFLGMKPKEKRMVSTMDKLVIKPEERKITLKHQAGLSIPQDADCTIEYGKEKMVFEGNGNIFSLSFDKITDICIKTEEEIRSQYVSSIGRAAAGAVLFGPLGAIVGGRTREKTTKEIRKYFIITYRNQEKVNYISFEIVSVWGQNAHVATIKWVEDFKSKQKNKNRKTIEL